LWILWLLTGVLAIGVIAGIAAVLVSRNDSKKAVADASAAHAASTPGASPSTEHVTPVLTASGDAPKPALDADDAAPALEAGDSDDDADDSAQDSPKGDSDDKD
jgi:hypothetical protein